MELMCKKWKTIEFLYPKNKKKLNLTGVEVLMSVYHLVHIQVRDDTCIKFKMWKSRFLYNVGKLNMHNFKMGSK